MERIISPSMLSADFGHLDRDTRMIDESAAQWIHIDVMDGVFVPNISFGFPVMKPIRRASAKFLDVHLMIVEPEKYLRRFAEAGADLVTFHYEATQDPLGAIRMIKECGVKAGISVKPATPVEVLGARPRTHHERGTRFRRPEFHGGQLGKGASAAPHDRRPRSAGADRDRRRRIRVQCRRPLCSGLRCARGRKRGVRCRRPEGGNREDAGGTVLPVTAAGAGSCRMCGREPWRMRYPKGAPLRCAFGHGMAHTVFAAGEACLKRIRLTDDFSR